MKRLMIVAALIAHSQPASAKNCTSQISTSAEFKKTFAMREACGSVEVRGLVGRVLRGKVDSDFTTLSDNPERRVIFLMGSDGLEKLVGLKRNEILKQIGYTKAYIEDLEKKKTRFKLVVFRPSVQQPTADWDHVLKLSEEMYPTVAAKIKAQTENLKTHSFSKIQERAPGKFADIEENGPVDPDYIDLKKLEMGVGSEWQVRGFLFNIVHVNELYTGSGFVHAENGKETFPEYVSPNLELSKLNYLSVIDF